MRFVFFLCFRFAAWIKASALACLIQPELYGTITGGVVVVPDGLTVGQTIFVPTARDYGEGWRDLPAQNVCIDVDAQGVIDLYMNAMLA